MLSLTKCGTYDHSEKQQEIKASELLGEMKGV